MSVCKEPSLKLVFVRTAAKSTTLAVFTVQVTVDACSNHCCSLIRSCTVICAVISAAFAGRGYYRKEWKLRIRVVLTAGGQREQFFGRR